MSPAVGLPKKFVEAVHVGQMFVQIPQMVLTKLPADVTVVLEQPGQVRVFGLHALLGCCHIK